jgi:hypothetical protein
MNIMLTVRQKRWWLLAGFSLIVLSALSLIFFKVTYTTVCETDSCFSEQLATCSRAEFLKDTTDARWYYKIVGPQENSCEVYVKLAQLRRGSTEIERLSGLDMNCFLPHSVVESPQKDIERCHGPLREEIQSILIQKMHSYLLENLGRINQEFTSII